MDERKYVEAFAVDTAQRRADFHQKLVLLRRLLTETSLDAVVLSLAHNFAWITGGGRSFINMASEGGVGSIYVDATQVVLLTNEIEGHRLIHEEMDGLQEDIKLHEDPWYDQPQALTLAKQLAQGSERIAMDAIHPEIEAKIGALRVTLTKYEQQVYRALGKDCGEIIAQVSRTVRPSMTEWEIASDLSARCWTRGITPIVALIAADERVDAIRHPLPTNKRIKNKVMIVLCGRRAGFVLSCTRIVYVTTNPGATVPAQLLRNHDAATYVDAVAIASSTPGAVAKDIFTRIQDAYKHKGFDGEWKLHHQGGAAGYKSREWIANPQLAGAAVVGLNQAFAWNPSVTGTKSEDTVLLYQSDAGELVHEVISESPDWPLIEHTVDGNVVKRPAERSSTVVDLFPFTKSHHTCTSVVNDPSDRKSIASPMAPTTTDALRELFSESQGQVHVALEWITSLTRESATNRRLFISDERVIPHVVTLFRAGNGNQRAVCVLTALAKSGAAVQSQIAEFDQGFLIPALVKQLTADSTQKANQANLVAALKALVSLADRHDANQARILSAGGITQTVALLQKQINAMRERVNIIKYDHRNATVPELATPVVAGVATLLRTLASCGSTASGRASVVTGGVIGVLVSILVGPFYNEVDRDKYKELRTIWSEWSRLVEPVVEELTHHGDASTTILAASRSSIPKLVQEASSSYLSALVWLGLLAKTSTEMQNTIVRNGGVATLYERLVSEKEDCVRLSAWALSNVADKNESVQLTVIEHGGIATLLPLLGASMDYRFSTIARLLGSLGEANSERHAEAIARAGGLPFLVAHLRYGTHERIQQWTIPMLQRVLFTGQDKHDNVAQTMFRKRGGLTVLDELCSSPPTKDSAMELLRDLAASDRVGLAKPEVLLKEADRHESTEWRLPPIDYVDAYATDLQKSQYYGDEHAFAVRALANLACSHPANRVLVAHTGVLVVLVQRLRSWSEKVHGYLGDQEIAAMTAVAKGIRNLASDAVNRDAFGLLDVVSPLIEILKSDKSLKLKAAAASALGSLASHGHTANQQAIVKHDGIPALVELLRAATKPKPQETAVTTLWVLAKDSSVHR